MRASHFFSVIIAMGASIGLSSLSGCDDDHHTVLLENKPATQPSAPTTQELLNGKQQTLALKIIPFTMKVPAGWNVKPDNGLMMLEGPTPSGIVQLQISKHLAPIEHHEDRLIEGAKREATDHPGPLVRADVRTLDSVKVLETRSLGATAHAPTIDAAGKIIAQTSTPLHWKISAFVTNGRDTNVCEVHFVDLCKEQYDLDHELLERIMASLAYDEKAESN